MAGGQWTWSSSEPGACAWAAQLFNHTHSMLMTWVLGPQQTEKQIAPALLGLILGQPPDAQGDRYKVANE